MFTDVTKFHKHHLGRNRFGRSLTKDEREPLIYIDYG